MMALFMPRRVDKSNFGALSVMGAYLLSCQKRRTPGRDVHRRDDKVGGLDRDELGEAYSQDDLTGLGHKEIAP